MYILKCTLYTSHPVSPTNIMYMYFYIISYIKNFIRPSSNCYDAAKAAKIKVPKIYEKHNMEVSERKWGILWKVYPAWKISNQTEHFYQVSIVNLS